MQKYISVRARFPAAGRNDGGGGNWLHIMIIGNITPVCISSPWTCWVGGPFLVLETVCIRSNSNLDSANRNFEDCHHVIKFSRRFIYVISLTAPDSPPPYIQISISIIQRSHLRPLIGRTFGLNNSPELLLVICTVVVNTAKHSCGTF